MKKSMKLILQYISEVVIALPFLFFKINSKTNIAIEYVFNCIGLLISSMEGKPCIRISSGLCYKLGDNEVSMIFSIGDLQEIEKYDYFNENERSIIARKMVALMCKVEKEKIPNVLTIKTHEGFEKILIHYAKKEKMTISSEYLWMCWQPVEKLFFVNSKVMRKNFFALVFWEKIFRKEKMYKFILKK